jgi:periplasmic divalent cation tolerance protein
MKEYIQIFTTTEKKEDAEKIAQTLVKERLAGCVQIIGTISSVYRWKNKIEKAEE